MKKIIIVVLILSVILGFLFWKYAPSFFSKSGGNSQIELKLWGLWEDDSLIKPAIEEYSRLHPNVKVSYNHQNSINYRTRVQTQIINNQGPDILLIHNSWLSMFLKTNSLAPLPISVMTDDEYTRTFYPVAKSSFSKNGKIYALPLEIDGLALYYNEDLLKNIGAKVPQTWPEFIDTASAVTVKDAQSNIKTAGAALGTTSNVDFWPDILGMLFSQQPGTSLEHPDNDKGAEVLKFYISFITDPKRKVWDIPLESSTQAFYEGKLAFYFAPSWRANELKVSNPNLHFKIAPVPQIPGQPRAAWATFWAFGVASNSPHQKEAWDFLKFLTSAQVEKLLYQEASKVRLFGEPYSRMDLQGEVSQDPLVGAYVVQGPYYKGWYLSSKTFDQGINDEMIKYFEDGVNSVVGQNQDPKQALQTVAKGVNQVLDKYVNITPTPK